MTILGYHGYQNWGIKKEENEDLDKVFTFGFELEVTMLHPTSSSLTAEQLATKLHRKFGDLFVYERDGSIGNGVEIISQPMTWKWFTNHIEIFKELLNICIESGFDSHNGNMCGLHVHIGRQSLKGFDYIDNKLNESKVIANMNFILERFQNDLFKFSRRTSRSFDQWTRNRTDLIQIEGNDFIEKNEIRNIGTHNSNRYTALNLSNSKTVEFRFLRGTLRFETFFISLNFIKNIVEQSKISNHSVTFKSLVLKDLDKEMQEYAKEYCSNRNINLEDKTVIFLEKCSQEKNIVIDKEQLANDILED